MRHSMMTAPLLYPVLDGTSVIRFTTTSPLLLIQLSFHQNRFPLPFGVLDGPYKHNNNKIMHP